MGTTAFGYPPRRDAVANRFHTEQSSGVMNAIVKLSSNSGLYVLFSLGRADTFHYDMTKKITYVLVL